MSGDSQCSALLRQVSPVAWQHINLQGRFKFNNRAEPIDMNAIIQKLSQILNQENAI
jgi:hypothetical protein